MIRNHTHKLKRHSYASGSKVYFCTLDCTFKIECQLALGQVVVCNLCGNDFSMSEYAIKLKLPHCEDCSKRKVKDSDGKSRFIRKGLATEILTSVAADTNQSLADRLKKSIASQLEDDL